MFKTQSVTADSDLDTQNRAVKNYFSTNTIAKLAMLVAINVVIGAISPRIGSLKITLTYMLCFIAGNFFGAVAGGIVGGLGDLLGCLLGGYAPNPLILLASVLIGVIPGLVRYINIKPLKKAMPYVRIAISFIAVFVICTLFVNSYALYAIGLAKGNSFWAYLGIRAATQSPIVAINLGLTAVCYEQLKKILTNAIL